MAKLTVRRGANAIRLYKGNVSAVAPSFERSRSLVYTTSSAGIPNSPKP